MFIFCRGKRIRFLSLLCILSKRSCAPWPSAIGPHTHDHGCDEHACAACAGCADPKQELMALMKYMVGHNTAHANELAQLAKQLQELGEHTAYEQIMLAVSDFEKGNLRLSTVLTSMNG